jgi:hypothetical protein
MRVVPRAFDCEVFLFGESLGALAKLLLLLLLLFAFLDRSTSQSNARAQPWRRRRLSARAHN